MPTFVIKADFFVSIKAENKEQALAIFDEKNSRMSTHLLDEYLHSAMASIDNPRIVAEEE